MSNQIPEDQLKQIGEATEDLGVAQRELERALTALTRDLPRSQKTMVSDVLKIAFEKVAAARKKLESVTSKG